MYVVIDEKYINLFLKDSFDYSDQNNPTLVSSPPFKFKPLAQPIAKDKLNQVFGYIIGNTLAFKDSGIEYIEVTELDKEFKELLTNNRNSWSLEQFLPKMKELKIKEFSKLCENSIVNGFSSSALTELHFYQSSRDDQANLIGAVTTNQNMPYLCSLDGKLWEYKLHTKEQLAKVLLDGATIKTTILQKFRSLKNQIISAHNIEKLEEITWKI